MAGITLLQAQTGLNAALAQQLKISTQGEEYSIAGRSLRQSHLDKCQASIEYWNLLVKQLTRTAAGRSRARTVVVGF
jgi:hypothetical protein